MVCHPPHKLVLVDGHILQLVKKVPFENKFIVVELAQTLETQFQVDQVSSITESQIRNRSNKKVSSKCYEKANLYLDSVKNEGYDPVQICSLSQVPVNHATDPMCGDNQCPDRTLEDITTTLSTMDVVGKQLEEIRNEVEMLEKAPLCSICQFLIKSNLSTEELPQLKHIKGDFTLRIEFYVNHYFQALGIMY